MPPYDSTLEEIKDRIDIVDFISEYVNLKKAGQNWKGLCPFHTEKTPSFTVSPAKQIFHCFGCGSGGDIFTFLVRYESLAFPEALRMLAQKAGVKLKASKGETAKAGEKEILLTMHKDALVFFQQNLTRNARASGYTKSRGIDRETRELFSLGYALNSWNALFAYLCRKGFKPETIKKAGLATQGSKGFYDTFRDRIIFPIYDLKGDVVAFGGRTIEGSEPKYLNSPETLIFNKRSVLYGLNRAKEAIKKTGYALFMEGYLDVITAHACGFTNAVAPLGTAFTREHGKIIKRFTDEVILVFDSDQAGIKAASNAANILLERGLSVKVLSFPENDDPDSFLRKKGKEAFQKLLDNPLSIIDFYMLQKGEKRLIAHAAIETLSRVSDKVLQGYYAKMLAEKLSIHEFFIIEELKKMKGQSRSGHKTSSSKNQPKPESKPSNEVFIIKLLLQLPEKNDDVCGFLSVDDFSDATLREIFRKMREGFTDFHEIYSRCSEEEKNLLTEISFRDDFENPVKALNDCMKRLKDNRRKILLKELHNKITEAELKKDFELLKTLQADQQRLLRSEKQKAEG